MLPPVLFILCIILMDFSKPIAGVKELDLLSDPELRAHGIVKALLPAELGLYRLMHHRADRLHRPPDFMQWAKWPAPACTARIDWRATRSWKRWCAHIAHSNA